jgi:hypothetical protein
MTHGSRGKAEERIKRQEEGPHWLNTGQLRGAGLHEHHRSGRYDPGRREAAHGISDPPPPLKGRKAWGVRNALHFR